MLWAKLKSIFSVRRNNPRGSALRRLAAAFGLDGKRCTTPSHQRTAFTMALVALAAKMAKADGVAVAAELDAFERWFHVPDDQRDAVRRVFDLAKRDVAGYEQYAQQIADLLAQEPELKHDVFECLFHVASADGVLHRDEETFLLTVAGIFGYDQHHYRQIRRMFVVDPDDPYKVLGVPHDISDKALKVVYRKLAMENHSDRLAAHGVPREFQSMADRKLAAINAAYDAVLKERAEHRLQTAMGSPDEPDTGMTSGSGA
ncbi:MAG: TerB family tellurite resistance protein [Hyphomicrobiaceae bacterium]|nr:TerB family tellurite resistance protein [Hyphomicrobiaceae bacterium]MCC0010748.1 TerB family tellurite resistance protein [Hyphomicrobiaceae bacterium]